MKLKNKMITFVGVIVIFLITITLLEVYLNFTKLILFIGVVALLIWMGFVYVFDWMKSLEEEMSDYQRALDNVIGYTREVENKLENGK